MSEDLHSNPPYQISQTELGPENTADIKTYKTGGKFLCGTPTCRSSHDISDEMALIKVAVDCPGLLESNLLMKHP